MGVALCYFTNVNHSHTPPPLAHPEHLLFCLPSGACFALPISPFGGEQRCYLLLLPPHANRQGHSETFHSTPKYIRRLPPSLLSPLSPSGSLILNSSVFTFKHHPICRSTPLYPSLPVFHLQLEQPPKRRPLHNSLTQSLLTCIFLNIISFLKPSQTQKHPPTSTTSLSQSPWPSRNTRLSSTTAAPSAAKQSTSAPMTTAQETRIASAARIEVVSEHPSCEMYARPAKSGWLHETTPLDPSTYAGLPAAPQPFALFCPHRSSRRWPTDLASPLPR